MPGICAIVVSFFPGLDVASHLSALSAQVDELVVIDNGSGEKFPQALREICAASKITLIANPANLGIAHAFNQGIEYALARNYPWIATFDQDSHAPPGFMAGLLSAWADYPQKDRVGIIAPTYQLEPETSRPTLQSGRLWREVPVVMASGNLLRQEAVKDAGLMDAGFFIDYVDFDYCLRLRRKGWRIIQATQVCLPHRLGAREEHRILGRSFSLVEHNPLRRYYNSRNRLATYLRYGGRFPGWMARDLAWWFWEIAKIFCFESNKAAKCRNIALGLRDGFKGRFGPAPDGVRKAG